MSVADETIDYFELFKQMDIKYSDLPENYNPDSYARSLLCNDSKASEISYAASTTNIENQRYTINHQSSV